MSGSIKKVTPGSLWENRKTGDRYQVREFAINTTNKQDGQLMVLYHHMDSHTLFVREKKEFLVKFKYIGSR